MSKPSDYRARIEQTLIDLGAAPNLLRKRHLPLHHEAKRLTYVEIGADRRDKFLAPPAAKAWLAMRDAAAKEDISLLLISAFRSFDYQLALIRYKIDQGRSIDDVLAVNAPPGCSEHHSGRAIDIGCDGIKPLEEDFETTQAFAWLTHHARSFGFVMSFPRDNRYGYLYEPWHWCWHRNLA